MPPAFRSVSTATGSNSCAPSLPTGAVAGDVLVALIAQDGNIGGEGQVPTPAGWTRLDDANVVGAGALFSSTFWKIVASGEAASYTFNASLANTVAATIFCASGASGNPIDAHTSITDTDLDTTVVAPSVTTNGPDRLVLRFYTSPPTGGRTFTTPTSHTERSDTNSQSVDEILVSAAGAAGTATSTVSSGSINLGAFTVAISPAGLPVFRLPPTAMIRAAYY